jgi:hypothetical protein
MRIGEVLGSEIDKHLSPDLRTVIVTQKVRHGKVEDRLNRELLADGGFASGESVPAGRVFR